MNEKEQDIFRDAYRRGAEWGLAYGESRGQWFGLICGVLLTANVVLIAWCMAHR